MFREMVGLKSKNFRDILGFWAGPFEFGFWLSRIFPEILECLWGCRAPGDF